MSKKPELGNLSDASSFLSGNQLPFFPNGELNDAYMLQILASDSEISDPAQQFKAIIAEHLISMGITGPKSVRLLHSIAEAASRISRSRDSDETLLALKERALGEHDPQLRVIKATELGDRGLQYASGWGGRHIRRIMHPAQALQYCLGFSELGYSVASSALPKRGDLGWETGLALLTPNLLTAQGVLDRKSVV